MMEDAAMSVDQIIHELEQARDGGNVHTVNKAIFYLRLYRDRGQDGVLASHGRNCQQALADRSFEVLRFMMRRLF